MPDRSKKWPGGYISVGSGHYFIYRRVGGRLFEIRTPATGPRAALAQLERFEKDPAGYKAQGEVRLAEMELDGVLGGAFLTWSRDEKKNTTKWVRDQKRALKWWEDKLAGTDLRTLKTSRLVALLDDQPSGRKQLIATLKTFYGWLVKVRHDLEANADPTLGLSVPQAKAKQLRMRKAIDRKEFDAAMKTLKGWPRDALEVLGATGWHVTELERFAKRGEVEPHPHNGEPVLRCPLTKGGAPLRTQVTKSAAVAAERILARGEVDYFELRQALRDAGATFNPGYLRHSVASWAINAGADPAAVAAFLGHKSPATTRKFYATHAVPAKIPTMGD